MSDDFSWTNESIDIPMQGPIAIYTNAFGDLVLREQGHEGEDDDVIVIRKENVLMFLAAIKSAMKRAK